MGDLSDINNHHVALELTSLARSPETGLDTVNDSSDINNHHGALEQDSTISEDALGPDVAQVGLEIIMPAVGTNPTLRPDLAPVVGNTSEPQIGVEPIPIPGLDPTVAPAQPLLESTQELRQTSSQRPVPHRNLPFQDLFDDGRRQDFFDICSPLYKASMEGDWTTAESILRGPNQDYQRLVQCSITDNRETMLHIAASSSKSVDFVQNLVGVMQATDLMYQNENGNTALCLAAMTGNVEIATIMVNKNRNLLTVGNSNKMTPLLIAAIYGKRDMVTYLDAETNRDGWTYENNKWVCLKCVETDLFDVALRLFRNIPDTPEGRRETQSILGVLARKPYAFEETKQHITRTRNSIMAYFTGRPHSNTSEAMQLLTQILTSTERWSQRVLYEILRGPMTSQRTYPDRVLFVAAEMGNTKFIVELFRKYPDLKWKMNDNQQSIFHVAVSHCHESIYTLLYQIGSMKDLIVTQKDQDGNTMLHLVAKNAENNRLQDVSGAAFQMQHQLLWYKEVESIIPPSYRNKKNKAGQTPDELFTTTHKDLVSEGEKWMRGTASKCMLVATLIATIVFGVAYTIPGGYDQKLGFPIFNHNPLFIVFVVLDAISLILSSTSILVFLSILTSRYAHDDFLESLPKKLMVGLTMLFLSIVTMMMAFSVSFYVLYRHKFIIVAGSISLLALIPIFSYVRLHFPLLKDMFHSTYGSRHLFKPKKQMLYCQNPRF